METNKITMTVIALAVAVILTMGVMVPVITDSTTGEKLVNEGAGWMRFAYDTGGSPYEITITMGDTVSVARGTDTQTYSDTEVPIDTILYADSNASVWLESDTLHILGLSDGKPVYWETANDLTITRSADGVTVSDGTVSEVYDTPSWAYVPLSTGTYGFFENGTEVNAESDRPLASVGGGFAGVYAYNNILRYNGLGLVMATETDEDGRITGTYWQKGTPEPEIPDEDTADLNLQPLDPSIINPTQPGAGLMAVPTPIYTDGDWGYDTMTVDGVTYAKIVSYSGAGGDVITVPATVGGYDVYQFGKGGSNQTVFNTSMSISQLIFSEGIHDIGANACRGCTGILAVSMSDSIITIGDYAFYGCTGLSNDLVLPSSLTSIGTNTFNGCSNLTGSLILPDSLTTVKSYAFKGCSKLTGDLIIPARLTEITNYAFQNCTGLNGTLVIPDTVTTIESFAFNNTGLTKMVVASDAAPGASAMHYNYSTTEFLDLSNQNYSQYDYWFNSSLITFSTSIGDSLGYITFTEKGSDAGVSGAIVLVLTAVPVVVLVGLVVGAVRYMNLKE